MFNMALVFVVVGAGAIFIGRMEKIGIFKEKRGVTYITPLAAFIISLFYVYRENNGFIGARPENSFKAETEVIPIVLIMSVWGLFRISQSIYLHQKSGKISKGYRNILEEENSDVTKRINEYRRLGLLYLVCAGFIYLIIAHFISVVWEFVV